MHQQRKQRRDSQRWQQISNSNIFDVKQSKRDTDEHYSTDNSHGIDLVAIKNLPKP
jgi:hypothetical protein